MASCAMERKTTSQTHANLQIMKKVAIFALICALCGCKTAKVATYSAQTKISDTTQNMTLATKYNFIIQKETITVQEKDSFDRITKTTQTTKTKTLTSYQDFLSESQGSQTTTQNTQERDTLQKVTLNSFQVTKSKGSRPTLFLIAILIASLFLLGLRILEH